MCNYDKELVRETLIQILKSADTILYRFKPVREVKDFTDSPAGIGKAGFNMYAADCNG